MSAIPKIEIDTHAYPPAAMELQSWHHIYLSVDPDAWVKFPGLPRQVFDRVGPSLEAEGIIGVPFCVHVEPVFPDEAPSVDVYSPVDLESAGPLLSLLQSAMERAAVEAVELIVSGK